MAENRLDFYKTHLIDNNKERDPLDGDLYQFDIKKKILWRVPAWAVNRPDLISYVHYRTTRLWWLIAQINDIEKPYEDIFLGRELYIPKITEYYDFYNIHSVVDEIATSGYDKRTIE